MTNNSENYQYRVQEVIAELFPTGSADIKERCLRFLEEATELVQSLGLLKEEAVDIIDYVYYRPKGKPRQEIGGSIVTLCALCSCQGFSLEDLAELELARIIENKMRIQQKQDEKPSRVKSIE